MISSRRSGEAWPNTASQVSISPSACRAPLSTSSSTTTDVLTTNGSNISARSPQSTPARIAPSISPTTGSHTTLSSSRYAPRGTGIRVRNCRALKKPPIEMPRLCAGDFAALLEQALDALGTCRLGIDAQQWLGA